MTRVLVAPDKFAGTLSAPEVARAIAEGWSRHAPRDVLTLAPMADGGPGFVEVLRASLGGELVAVTVTGPLGAPTPVMLLVAGDAVYLESAQACGLHVVDERRPLEASTRGVGEALAVAARTARERGARRVVVGLGGSATNDGGAGLLGALGATADVPLDAGPAGLDGVTSVDLAPARRALEGLELVAATDVTIALLGLFGATKTFGPQKGLDEPDLLRVDAVLDAWVRATCGTTPAERRLADAPGAGAAGGLGFALLLLGASVRSGVELVADAVGLTGLAEQHDLVLSGEGAYDHTSRAGKVVHGVAAVAASAARPCVVLAGRVTVGAREMRAMGVESAYAISDLVGEEAALADAHASLAALAERVARSWTW